MSTIPHFHEPADRRFDRLTRSHAGTAFEAFVELNGSAMGIERENGLTRRQQELIAVACALVTQCAWCLEAHSRAAAKVESISKADIAALIMTVANAKIRFTLLPVADLLDDNTGFDAESSARGLDRAVEGLGTLSRSDARLIEFATATLLGSDRRHLQSLAGEARNAGASTLALHEAATLTAVMHGSAAVAHGRLIWKFFQDDREDT